jgi:FkbM family methyltransferase
MSLLVSIKQKDYFSEGKDISMKKYIYKLLALLGYKISKIKDEIMPTKTMPKSVEQVARTHNINTIIDIGASNGTWSQMALSYYPLAQYLLIEAQPVHKDSLSVFIKENKNTQFVLAAAGDSVGQIYFDASEPLSGQASYTPYQNNNIVVPVVTVDSEVSKRGLSGPYLLKLDTHGFEVPIFKGAAETLKETDVIIVECYNFKIAPECLLFHEMCNYLGELGFRCIDLADPLWRPLDQSFWQMDLVFVRNDRPEFEKLDYK